MLIFNIDERLTLLRIMSGYTTVVQEYKTCYTVEHPKGYDGAPVEGHMIPFLDDYDDLDSVFLAWPTDHQPDDRYTIFNLCDVSPRDLPKLVPGARFWRVVSVEDNAAGDRQRVHRIIFEDDVENHAETAFE